MEFIKRMASLTEDGLLARRVEELGPLLLHRCVCPPMLPLAGSPDPAGVLVVHGIPT